MTIETTSVPRENLTLVEHGLFPIRIFANLTAPMLIEHALRRGEGVLTDRGAFTAVTAPHTGRSAKDKFLVEDPTLSERIWWEKNVRLEPAAFDRLQRALADMGTPRAPAESVSELAQRPAMRGAAGAFAVVERTSYGARAPVGAEADSAVRTLDELTGRLREDLAASEK